jgi:hypothetical protein
MEDEHNGGEQRHVRACRGAKPLNADMPMLYQQTIGLDDDESHSSSDNLFNDQQLALHELPYAYIDIITHQNGGHRQRRPHMGYFAMQPPPSTTILQTRETSG